MANSDRENVTGSALSADLPHHSHRSEETHVGGRLSEEGSQTFNNDPMELDSQTQPQNPIQTENESIVDAETKAPDQSATTETHPGPPIPAKTPFENMPVKDSSQQKELEDRLEDALDDKKHFRKSLIEAEERIKVLEEFERRAISAEKEMATARAHPAAQRHNDRDHVIATYKANEKIYIQNERVYKGIERDYKTNQNQLLQHQEALQTLKKREAEAQEGIRHWKGETQLWMSKANQYEADLKQIQEKSLREMASGRWNPIPDKDLRDRLYVLYLDVRDWAKTWAAPSMNLESMPQESRKEFFQSFLPEFVRLDSAGALPAEIVSPSPKMKDKIPWLLLSSALSCEIVRQFFRNPFFCADAKHVDALKETHERLLKASPREGHIWRSMMWRILNPPAAGPQEKATLHETQQRLLSLCDKVDAEFKKGPARPLLRAGESDGAKVERAKALRDILMKAAGIATSLWVQRSYLECVGINTLVSRKYAFDVQSPIMQSHALNKVDLEDHSNNGRRILLVVRPALLAFDEDDTKGLNGEGYRVLAPAIVFLEDMAPRSSMRSYLGL